MIILLARTLITSTRFPSRDKRLFGSVTIGYYLEWARELDTYGVFTPAWCGGFDLLRFYPPLGLMILLLLGKILDGVLLALPVSYVLSLILFGLGFYTLGEEITVKEISPDSNTICISDFRICINYISLLGVYQASR